MLGYEFQLISLTFKWELRLISPAGLKIEISRDRRTITGSCFPGVPCQPSCRVSALFIQFLLKCSAPKSSTYIRLQHFTAFITFVIIDWCQYTTTETEVDLCSFSRICMKKQVNVTFRYLFNRSYIVIIVAILTMGQANFGKLDSGKVQQQVNRN